MCYKYVCVHVDMGMNVYVCGMYVYVHVDMGVYVYMDTRSHYWVSSTVAFYIFMYLFLRQSFTEPRFSKAG